MKKGATGLEISCKTMSNANAHVPPSLPLIIERWGPLTAGVVCATLLCLYANEVVEKFSSGGWKASNLYSAIFGWAAVQTGFAFGVYGFIAGRRDGFVGALQGTTAMEGFVTYIKRANWAGFLLTFASIPLIVVSPSICTAFSWSFVLVTLWFSGFVWAFCSFLRLAYNFTIISGVKDKVSHGA